MYQQVAAPQADSTAISAQNWTLYILAVSTVKTSFSIHCCQL